MNAGWLAMMLGLVQACPSQSRRAAARLEGRYDVGQPEGWLALQAGGADWAWSKPEMGATIYTDSNCLSRFHDGRLEDLASHLTAGIASGPPIRQEQLWLDDRGGLLTVYIGQVDGVAVQLAGVVLKKDRCVYDMLYFAPIGVFDDGWDDFVGVYSGFKTHRR